MPEPVIEEQKHVGRMQELVGLSKRVMHRLADPKVPIVYKLIPAAAMLYVVSPLDLIPDPMLGLGQLDDIAVLLIAARMFVELTERKRVTETSDDNEPATVTTTYRVADE